MAELKVHNKNRTPRRNPTPTPVHRSPAHPTSPSPAFLPPSSSRPSPSKSRTRAVNHPDMRRSSGRGKKAREAFLDELEMAGDASWDWRSRHWVTQDLSPLQQPSEAKPSSEAKASNNIAPGSSRLAGGIIDGEEGMSEARRQEIGQIVTRIRRQKVSLRSRRRGTYHGIDIHMRRKLLHRDCPSRRGSYLRRDSPRAGVPLQLCGDSLQAAKSFSLLTLEEYLKEHTSVRTPLPEEKAGSFNTDAVSPVSSLRARVNCPKIRTRNVSQPCRTSKRSMMVVASNKHPNNSDSIADEDSDDENGETSGCGISWRWSNGYRHIKDNNGITYSGSCFPVSRRRVSKRFISRGRKGHKWDKYMSEASLSSFKSDVETVPLMTEPEPLPDSTSDDFGASSSEPERRDPPLEPLYIDYKSKRSSRYREDSRKSGNGLRETSREPYCMELTAKKERGGTNKHRSLSQKYRPKDFKDLIGQPMVSQSLSSAILREKIAPVYLFQGPRGTGKTSAARMFAAALNCLTSEELRPCGLCSECLLVNSGKNLDVREVDAAGHKGIDSMKSLLKHISLPPSSSRYKVFVIDECHMLEPEAWNAFLKSLEEPPSYVVFILITTDPEQLPRTAVSRCQKFLFSKIRDADVVLRLQKLAVQESIDVDLEALQLIATRSDGSLRDAETTLDQLSLLGKRVTVSVVQELAGLIPDDKLEDLLDLALSADSSSTVKSIREFMVSGVEPLALISQLATLITDILAGNNKSAEYRFKNVRKIEEEKFRQVLRILSDAEKQLRSCSDRTTWLTAAFLQFSQNDPATMPSSSLGTSVTQSPVNFFDNSEKEMLDFDHVGIRQPRDGEQNWNDQSSSQFECIRAACQQDLKGRVTGNCSHHLAGPLLDNKIYPCDQSPHSDHVGEVRSGYLASTPLCIPRAYSTGLSKLEQREGTAMSPCSMDNLWHKVLEGSRSNVLRQLLQGDGRLVSLAVTEAYAIAHIEFRSPDHRNVAERASPNIAKAFEVALGCPVEIKITGSCTQSDSRLRDKPLFLEQHGRNMRSDSLSKLDDRAYNNGVEDSLQLEQGRNQSSSMRTSSGSMKLTAPAPSSTNSFVLEQRKGNRCLESPQKCSMRRFSTDISDRERDRHTLNRKKVKEGANRSNVQLEMDVEGRSSLDVIDLKGTPSGKLRRSDTKSQDVEDNGIDAYSQDLRRRGLKGMLEHDADAETEYCDSPLGGNATNDDNDDDDDDDDKDSSGSEAQDRYGPGILCWKGGSRINDHKVKHQRLRRKRRAGILLRFVPCANGEGRG